MWAVGMHEGIQVGQGLHACIHLSKQATETTAPQDTYSDLCTYLPKPSQLA